jgi:hypothetical protein
VVLTTHHLLALRSRKSRAIPLPPLWAFGSVTGYLYTFLQKIGERTYDKKMHCRIFPKTGKRKAIIKENVKSLRKIFMCNSKRKISISGKNFDIINIA